MKKILRYYLAWPFLSVLSRRHRQPVNPSRQVKGWGFEPGVVPVFWQKGGTGPECTGRALAVTAWLANVHSSRVGGFFAPPRNKMAFFTSICIRRVPLSAIACSRFGVTTSSSKQWAYNFVKWNDHYYEITDETVGQAETGGMLGKIIKQSTDEHDEFPNGSSNYLQEGAELYAIRVMSTMIYKEGQWQAKRRENDLDKLNVKSGNSAKKSGTKYLWQLQEADLIEERSLTSKARLVGGKVS
ncbi:hypothetical protein SY88_18955 [Clostridiales bacterium PH28_bin88]|nr:hypothetical protein SY88_18955 [Clostridiales bacterium PH28_bin88]